MSALYWFCVLLIFGRYNFSEVVEPKYGGISDTIKKLIEHVRDSIPEPITIPNTTIDLNNNTYLSGTVNVTDLTLKGIKQFNMTIKSVLAFPKSFILVLDYVELNLNYSSDVCLLNQPLLSVFGEGPVVVSLTNLTATGKLNVIISPFTITVQNMTLSLTNAEFAVSGLLNDQNFTDSINRYLNNNFANLFNIHSDEIATAIEPTVNEVLSEIIPSNFTSTSEEMFDYMTEENTSDVFRAMIERILSALPSMAWY
ncbi:hypothetical protein NQ318_019820 [Aromia moschata]|uniref:Uncharacterized protein n=1 Tax=Aromia moschata TaxID=1265417 RepID=A0AAV8YJ57_9CUCU|nr:hypothetical protein NQ318_019820 [Aromia moschata]